MTRPQPFDLVGPLPEGVTVLEASAGTGKTYALAALAARYVADGLPLDRLLLVSFTRMATGELRTRVRDRLVVAEHALATGDPGGDEVHALLLSGPADAVAERRRRLSAALERFDAATITTTHGFCAEALGSLGLAGDDDRGATLLPDAGDLVSQVVDDLLVARWANDPSGELRPSRQDALAIGREAVKNPTAPIVPPAGTASQPSKNASFAALVREDVEFRKRRARTLTYDDLLTRLRAVLTGPGGPAAAARLRERFHVVLVDEFQDTDPAQWDIVQLAFTDARALVLIGDPKQAIYAFRGADVHAYLEATALAGTQRTLGTNYRSDGPLLRAFDGIFGELALGDEQILHRHVEASPEHAEARITGAGPPMRVRVAHRADDMAVTATGLAESDPARAFVAADVAAEAVALLESGAEIDGRAMVPGDLAVLVRTNRQAHAVHDALRAADVPAVSGGAGSVFATPAAGEWLNLLEALERPSRGTRANAVALTCFVGWSAAELAGADDHAREELHRRLHGWARVLREAGVASLVERLVRDGNLAERMLARRGGERQLTDVRHIGELLHRAGSAERFGATALASWLRTRADEVGTEEDELERTRRLESDADAVQVLTIHRSKGLEFPVVLCPFLWDAVKGDAKGPIVFHDPASEMQRTVDVALAGADYRAHHQLAVAEARGEDLRLAYVALTRARHAVVLWWAASYGSRWSPLSRLVFGRGTDDTVPDDAGTVPSDEDAMAAFEALADRSPGCIGVQRATPRPDKRWSPPATPATELTAAHFDRTLDVRWRRASYSGIVAGASGHAGTGLSEPEVDVLDDEPSTEEAVVPAQDDSPWELVPGGMKLGTLVHEALEGMDYAAPDLDADLASTIDAAPLTNESRDALGAGLAAAILTPLNAKDGGWRLRDVGRHDRLDEMTFELPLAGGDATTGDVTPGGIAGVLARHADDTHLVGYAQHLREDVPPQQLRGYLTGAIDLITRFPDGRFVVLDFKTNRLDDYDPATLDTTMQRSHYALQAVLYLVALHRYLRWRLPGYDPEAHLGGARYLFLRGMNGTPGRGVFDWRPSASLVLELSDLLETGDTP